MHLPAREIPTLQSARLRLRAPTLNDLPQSLAMWSDPDVSRHISGKPSTEEEVWGRLIRYVGHWCLIGYGYWVVEAIEDGAYVGEVGFGDYRRAMVPPLDRVPEMGWVLATRAHGQGLATEAARAALAWRDSALPPGPTVSIVAPEHGASLRVAAKLGFHAIGQSMYRAQPTVVLRRNAPT